MLQAFEQTDFADGRRGDSIVFFLQSNFFQRHHLVGQLVAALVHDTVSALAQLLQTFVAIQLASLLYEALGLCLGLGLGGTHHHIHSLASCLHCLSSDRSR